MGPAILRITTNKEMTMITRDDFDEFLDRVSPVVMLEKRYSAANVWKVIDLEAYEKAFYHYVRTREEDESFRI